MQIMQVIFRALCEIINFNLYFLRIENVSLRIHFSESGAYFLPGTFNHDFHKNGLRIVTKVFNFKIESKLENAICKLDLKIKCLKSKKNR